MPQKSRLNNLFLKKKEGSTVKRTLTVAVAAALTVVICAALVSCGENSADFSSVQAGDIIKLGRYEQDNNLKNGTEQIEWLVLEVKDGKAFVISEYALDRQPYNTTRQAVTWETCSLRTWMNETFINEAFTENERRIILTTTVTADINRYHDNIPQGNDTEDKLFLLSLSEAERFFPLPDSSPSTTSDPSEFLCSCKETPYSSGQKEYFYTNWLLRTKGSDLYRVCYVFWEGVFHAAGVAIEADINAVRPAMWIEIEK